MSFFDQQDPTVLPEDTDPRIRKWGERSEIQTAATPGYGERVKQAQASAINATANPSIQNGRIVRAIRAPPRSNLPGNVHGFHDTSSGGEQSWDAEYTPDLGTLPSYFHGQSLRSTQPSAWSKGPPENAGTSKQTAWSAKDLTNMVPEAQGFSAKTAANQGPGSWAQRAGQSSAAKARMPPQSNASQHAAQSHEDNIRPRHGQSFASRASEQAPAAAHRQPTTSTASTSVPPHLRPPPQASSNSAAQQPQPKMKSGKAAKSAKYDSPFPCTYDDCTRGFAREKDMKKHKGEDHDWCRVCNEDFEDDDALLFHKINSERHICCAICGDDFRSESGRDRHQRQFHATQQEVKCVGCGYVFDRGAGLIDHIYTSKCSNTGGVHPGTVNEYKLRESRAAAALHLSQILEQTSRRASITAEQIAAIQPRSEQGSVAEYESTIGGGVTLLDDDVPTGNSMQGALAPAGASKGESTPTKPAVSSWPTLGEAASIGSTQENSMIEGLDTLHIGTSNGVRPPQRVRGFKSTGWADTPFSENKPTPVKGEWTAPTMPDYRKNFLPSASGPEKLIRTDWDFMKFERHGVDNNFHCPFVACGCSYVDVEDLLAHLTSGYHQGTDHRCLKCLKVFKSPTALIAHMESSSERCRMRETQSFGNVLHVVSGGYLGVQGRHADGTIKIQAPEVDDENDRFIMQVEDDEDREERKPVMLLPHQRVLARRNGNEW